MKAHVRKSAKTVSDDRRPKRGSARGNLILIGMPGSGKSTVGKMVAERLGLRFVDTDRLIESAEGRSLQEIVDRDGYRALRRIEERLLVRLCFRDHVIATGGSVVYSHAAMTHLKTAGIAVLLDADLSTLRGRVRDYATRGLAKAPDQSLESLFEERAPLYQRYADLVIPCGQDSQEEVADRLIAAVETLRNRHSTRRSLPPR
jgi:shikimate kinase